MSSNRSGDGDIRKAIIEADLVGCMIALPGPLFYSPRTQGSALAWHLSPLWGCGRRAGVWRVMCSSRHHWRNCRADAKRTRQQSVRIGA
ncbi:MAG: N-6 DNA methylase [Verrucomicrobiales bacterium]|nr:N-6 DNA methylase [Verrucomicrobiales bacterium]